MASFFKKMSLVPKGLKYKTMIAFSLMSLIPLLICFWLATTYIFPNIDLFLGLSLGNISLILGISLVISLLGLYLTKQMIDPIVRIAGDAKIMAEGEVERMIDVKNEDEIADLSSSLNIMTQKIRDNIEELRVYGERTKLINIEINKKVVALSSLLQIGNIILSSSDLTTILDFITSKISDIDEGSASAVILLDEGRNELRLVSGCNIDEDKLSRVKIGYNEIPPRLIVVDRDTPPPAGTTGNLFVKLGLKNIAVLPIIISKKQYGILLVSNDKDGFVFKDDEKELLKIFLKQVTIAVENNLLLKKARELAVKDELTGLYNEGFIHGRLEEEIRRSVLYQRPCGYLLIDVDGFKEFYKQAGEKKAETLLKAVGDMVKGAVTEVDRVGRLASDRFAVVLPERNKKQAANIAEDLRRRIEEGLGKIMQFSRNLTVSIGVSENPIDGSSADELMAKAELLVKNAKSLGKNRIVA